MVIYLITILLIIILEPVISIFSRKDKLKRNYIFLICFWLFLLLILRSETVGADLLTYIDVYAAFGKCPWGKMIQIAEVHDNMEIGYIVLNKLLYKISASPRFLIIVISFF